MKLIDICVVGFEFSGILLYTSNNKV